MEEVNDSLAQSDLDLTRLKVLLYNTLICLEEAVSGSDGIDFGSYVTHELGATPEELEWLCGYNVQSV